MLHIETTDIILSKQRIKEALIRLRGCAGCSAPLLFAYGKTGFLLTWLIYDHVLHVLQTKKTN